MSAKSRKAHGIREGNTRGIYAVRRPLHDESFEVFDGVVEHLAPKLRGRGKLFKAPFLHFTVIPSRRFTRRCLQIGPTTQEISKRVESCQQPLDATLGKLAIFGAGEAAKLGFHIQSEQLEAEIGLYEEAYADAGFPLRSDRRSKKDWS